MKTRRFRPEVVETLEGRLVLSAFATPFTIVKPLASEINPKFLNLTGRTESAINNAITSDFNHFEKTLLADGKAYVKAVAKTGANIPALQAKLLGEAEVALAKLEGQMTAVAHMVPFGGLNLNPVLQNRLAGTTGVTDTTTGVNTPSLEAQGFTLIDEGNVDNMTVKAAIASTESLVRSDVADYIYLGVTNGDFKLTRGATLPKYSG